MTILLLLLPLNISPPAAAEEPRETTVQPLAIGPQSVALDAGRLSISTSAFSAVVSPTPFEAAAIQIHRSGTSITEATLLSSVFSQREFSTCELLTAAVWDSPEIEALVSEISGPFDSAQQNEVIDLTLDDFASASVGISFAGP